MSRGQAMLAWCCVAVIAFSLKASYDANLRTEGRRQVAEAERTIVIRDAALREDSLRAAFRVQSADYLTQLVRWQGVKQRLRVRYDTLPPDTILTERVVVVRDSAPPALEDVVDVANRTINACHLALGTCEARTANLVLQVDSITASRDYWRHEAKPSLVRQFQQIPGRVVQTGVVVGLTLLFARWATAR